MAKSATARSADTNTDGYRDYRGVTVFGAWLWDNDMGIGLAVEIDKSESLQPYFYARFTLAIVITIVVLLTVLLFYFQQAREREKQKLFKATVRATQHILNNLINQMQLFKMEADRTQAFDERIKKLFMESLQEGQDLVSRLGRVSEITEDAISKSVAPK
jgi:ABC-type multidrug transport system fused ATPase/permease subunit